MGLKITTLIENMPDTENKLVCEHGFSVFIEFDGMQILFDTGQSGIFLENAWKLGIKPEEADYVILSHGHYDHTGGVPALVNKMKKPTSFYVGNGFFEPKYKKTEENNYKYNGNPFTKEQLEYENSPVQWNIVKENVTWLTEKMVLFKNFERRNSYETVNPKFFLKTEDEYRQDLFAEEIALGLVTEEGLVLIVGCSHVGIVNIVEHVKEEAHLPICAVLGGTHLVEAGEERLRQTVERLRTYGIGTIAVSHCTGEKGMELLRKEFSDGFVQNNTGHVMSF